MENAVPTKEDDDDDADRHNKEKSMNSVDIH